VLKSLLENTRYSSQVLMKLGFSRQLFEKVFKNQILLKCVHWKRICSKHIEGQTNRQTRRN